MHSPCPFSTTLFRWWMIASSPGAGVEETHLLDLVELLDLACVFVDRAKEIGECRDAATLRDRHESAKMKIGFVLCVLISLSIVAWSYSAFVFFFSYPFGFVLLETFFPTSFSVWNELLCWLVHNNKMQHVDRFFALDVLCKMMHFCAFFAQTNYACSIEYRTTHTRFTNCFRSCPIFSNTTKWVVRHVKQKARSLGQGAISTK